MTKKVQVHVGTIEDMGQRFVDAWHRTERGEVVDEEHITFPDLETLLSAMTKKRMELLRHLRHRPERNVAELARALGRDYKRVREDVQMLAGLGLIERGRSSVRVTVDEINASMRL